MSELRLWVKEVGFPIAIALMLMGLLLKTIPEMDDKIAAMATVTTRHADDAYGRGTLELRLLRLICRNGAKDRASELECDRDQESH